MKFCKLYCGRHLNFGILETMQFISSQNSIPIFIDDFSKIEKVHKFASVTKNLGDHSLQHGQDLRVLRRQGDSGTRKMSEERHI